MNNLVLQQTSSIQLLNETNNLSFTIDFDFNVSYIINDCNIYSLNLETENFSHLTNFVLEDVDAKIVCLKYLIEDKLLFILFQNGKIISYDIINNELLEHVLDVSSAIDCAKFSHDQELLVVSTQDGQMLLFNKFMVLTHSYNMNKDEYGTNEMVNVNWGSKETQFHGEGMRDKRHAKEELFPLSKWDSCKSYLDWRGDDDYFVINFVCSKGFRVLKIFNREGILQHTSEYVSGLERLISWKPSGNLIAASKISSNKHEIIFFEKNGLQHGSFELIYEPNSFIIEKLEWSVDSDILLVCGYKIQFETDSDNYQKLEQHLMLFTQSNYHWYLKQKFNFYPENFIENFIWDENEYSLLHFLSSSGNYNSNLFRKQLHSTSDGTVFVVDSHQLHISDFKTTVIPPPMSNYSINFQEKSQQVSQICYSNELLAVFLNDDTTAIFRLNNFTIKDIENMQNSMSYSFTNISKDFGLIYTPVFIKIVPKMSKIVLPIVLNDGRIYGIIDKQMVCFQYETESLSFIYNLTEPICMLTVLLDTLLFSSISNQFYYFDTKTNSCYQNEILFEMQSCYDRVCLQSLIYIDSNKQSHVIVLTKNSSLYYDKTLLMKSSVNSVFIFKNKYLLFATTDSLFYCWPLENFDLSSVRKNFPPRSLEKGSKIISVSNSEAKVVLQLPRGNLEAFYPRTLVLDQVNVFLDMFEYKKAFEILRKNRINLNYICDYNFEAFLNNCNLFLEQIDQEHVDWVNLFLFDLSSENSFATLNHKPEVKIENKINLVCDCLLNKMVLIDEVKFLKPILLSYVKRENPEIANALFKVKKLSSRELQDVAVKFLLLIVNVNRLFDEALGTYDFDILLMIASKSNKDPKEYVALINGFMEIEDENYRKYKIDLYLQRYKSCLFHLQKCENMFDEALELIENKHLFKEAIEIYDLTSPINSSKYSGIWNLYGDYLFRKKYYEEAAIVYKRASNYTQAFKMYIMSSNWNLASVCARKISKDLDEFKKMIYSVSQQLTLNSNYVDGAYVVEKYMEDYKQAFLILVQGHEWDRAIRCYTDYNLDESLFENEFKSELTNSYDSIMEAIDSTLTNLSEYLSRLQELQELRVNIQNLSNSKFDADWDAYSDTSSICDTASVNSSESNTSVNTLKTNRSNSRARHLKRLEQKKYVLKKGSPNEDIQIVYAVKKLVTKSLILFTDSAPLIKILYDLFYVKQSNTLQSQLDQLQKDILHINDFIWNSEYFAKRLAEDDLLRTGPELKNFPEWKIVLN